MPVEMERALKKEARKKGLSKKRTGAYVYGTMRKQGWQPRQGMSKWATKAARRVHKTMTRK